jgi:SusD/RagB-like outer membrane lipoprotein
MKNIYQILVLLALVMLTGTSCKKYLDINSNPTVPQETKAEYLLPPIIYQMTNGTSQDYRIIWKITQDMVGTDDDLASVIWERHGFPAASDVGGVIWRMTYVDLGLNLENMINDGIANNKYEYVGIGYAIKAWTYQMATDLHGPIILDEAFRPDLLTFHYQDQPEVYAKVREYGQLALKYLGMKSPISYAGVLAGTSGDFMYKGDMAKWKKFVYALFALQYSHLRNKPQFQSSYADSVIKYTDLSFADESESATIGFTTTSIDDSNPLGPQVGYFSPSSNYYGKPTTQILQYLSGGVRGTPETDPKSSIDPRLTRMFSPSSAVATLGIYMGVTPTEGTSTPNVPIVYGAIPAGGINYNGKYIFDDAARYPIMTFAQLQFAKAEALFIKGNIGEAYNAYIKGIRGHMNFCNRYGMAANITITENEITDYLASTEVAQSPGELRIADIMGQKYISQWGWAGLEQWCDIRKYHYSPQVYRNYFQIDAADLSSVNHGEYAYRFRPRYNSEYVWNAEELAKWGALDADYMTHELWFSQN